MNVTHMSFNMNVTHLPLLTFLPFYDMPSSYDVINVDYERKFTLYNVVAHCNVGTIYSHNVCNNVEYIIFIII